jgi:L,D-transpeptidase catalytic domain
MRTSFLGFRRQWLETLLAMALGILCWQIHAARAPIVAAETGVDLHAEQGRADLSLRNADYPRTFIGSIRLDLRSPEHQVHLEWVGPRAAGQERGPFHSSPGRGRGTNDCNNAAESRRAGSHCTPKGVLAVQGFNDHMPSLPPCRFVTWFHLPRSIAIHSHTDVPDHPASSGCVRLGEHAAQLIHNNAIAGRTQVVVAGTWSGGRLADAGGESVFAGERR